MQTGALTGLAAVLCCSCALQQMHPLEADSDQATQVAFQDVTTSTPVAANRLVLKDNESFLPPLEAEGNKSPVYPAELLSARLPLRVVCLQIGIDESGRVTSASQAPTSAACPSDAEPPFFAASAAAVKSWGFDPALRCAFPDVATKEMAVANCSGGQEIPQAVSIVYRFRFDQIDGNPSVRIGQ